MECTEPTSNSFEICDTSSFPAFDGYGMAVEIKTPVKFHFTSLKEQLRNPSNQVVDFVHMDAPDTLLIAMEALHRFRDQHDDQLPSPWDEEHAQEVLRYAIEIADGKVQGYVHISLLIGI